MVKPYLITQKKQDVKLNIYALTRGSKLIASQCLSYLSASFPITPLSAGSELTFLISVMLQNSLIIFLKLPYWRRGCYSFEILNFA